MDAAKAAHVPDAPLHDLYKVNWAYCLKYGWDADKGGFYGNGLPGQPAGKRQKTWWVQAEVLVSSLKMYKLTGEPVYRDVFQKTWGFVERELIDWKVGAWHAEVSPDGRPRGDKAQIWKAGYHDGRALVECLRELRAI
ncbi:MAG: AGE family epimerase/isomerase [Acidobacteriota bacterium]